MTPPISDSNDQIPSASLTIGSEIGSSSALSSRGPFQFTIDERHIVDEDYFSLESIFATNTAISCTFEPNTPLDLFPLLGQKAPAHISEKCHRANVPAWILPAVEHVCTFSEPTVYNAVNRDVIHAGAQAANLEQLQRYYYTLGMYICRLLHGERGRQIAFALLSAFIQRIGRILRDCIQIGAKPIKMDETEKKIFGKVQKMENRKDEWMTNRQEEGRRNRRSAKRKHCGEQAGRGPASQIAFDK